jgi:predicted flap endonuclease-1-like 5' DNA nuclease/predicted  nucleic acid-binding Zn-ribbon protein
LEQESTASRLAHSSAESEIRERAATATDLGLQLAVRDADLATANSALSELRARVKLLTEETDYAARRIPQLETDLASQSNTAAALMSDLQAALRGQADAQSAAGDAHTVLSSAHQALDAARKAKAELDAAAKVHTTEAEAAQAELVTLRQQLNRLQTQLKDVKSDSGPLEQRLRSRQDEVKQLTDQAGEAAEEIAALKLRAAQAEANLDAASKTRSALEKENAEREKQFAVLTEKTAELEAELKAISQAHAGLQAELEARPATSAASSLPVAVAPSNEVLLAELDQMARERNALAAELATLRLESPVKPAATPKPRRPRKEKVAPASETALSLLPESAAIPAEPTPVEVPEHDAPIPASACPQQLAEVKGIDTLFEQRLYAAGIGSFWSLAQLSDDQLAGILELGADERAAVDFEDLRHDAARLARETDSVGRHWNGSQPDDLEVLDGLGPALERRLYAAGICTFESLAGATPETLEAICPGNAQNTPDYARWIAQARARIAARES